DNHIINNKENKKCNSSVVDDDKQEEGGAETDNVKNGVQQKQNIAKSNHIINNKENKKLPLNGVVIFYSKTVDENGKKIEDHVCFEPYEKINEFLYSCDYKFNIEPLLGLIPKDYKFGFIIMDGKGIFIGTLQQNSKEILRKFTVKSLKKHGRKNGLKYDEQINKAATECFILNDKLDIDELILAGADGYNPQITQSDMLNQYYEKSQNSGKFCSGVKNTLKALNDRNVKTLLCWEKLTVRRYVFVNKTNPAEKEIKRGLRCRPRGRPGNRGRLCGHPRDRGLGAREDIQAVDIGIAENNNVVQRDQAADAYDHQEEINRRQMVGPHLLLNAALPVSDESDDSDLEPVIEIIVNAQPNNEERNIQEPQPVVVDDDNLSVNADDPEYI
ncbi:hypothetical protein HCN44_009921, partial [Aphidius gifuensis]